MKKDNIEISFTEEEKKSFESRDNAVKNTETQKSSSSDRQQKTVFSVLAFLLVCIVLFCVFFREDSSEINQPEENVRTSRKMGSLNLSKGESTVIADENNNRIDHILVGVGWDPAPAGSIKIDVDSTVILANSTTGDTFAVCYYKLRGPGGCVIHHGDNLTGRDSITDFASESADDENIDVYLDKINENYDRIYFVLNIFRSDIRRQTLNQIKNMYINIYNPQTKQLLLTYRVNEYTPGTAVVLGVSKRIGTEPGDMQLPATGRPNIYEWDFTALGNFSNAKDISQLCDLCSAMH